MYRGWTLPLVDGASDCRRLDPALYGTDNILDLVGAWSFGFAMGEQYELMVHGWEVFADWSTIEDDTFAMYVSIDGVVSTEMSYGLYYDLDDCYVLDPNLELLSSLVLRDDWPGNLYGVPYYWVTL